MQEEELRQWEIDTLTTRPGSYRALARLETLLNHLFLYPLTLISETPLQAVKKCALGASRAPVTCHESQFSHLRPLKGHLSRKNGEISTYTHLNEWQSCTGKALPERCSHEAIRILPQFDWRRKKTTMNICLFPGLRQQRLPTRLSGLQATGALCLLVHEINNPFDLTLPIGYLPA